MNKWGNRAAGRGKTGRAAAAPAQSGQSKGRQIAGLVGNAPIQAPVYDLAELIAGITDENWHESVDMGPPVGREAW